MLDELRRWWVAPEHPVLVRTSGSTGAPRSVALSAGALAFSAAAAERRLGGPAAWVLALPVEFVAGLQVLVRSLVAGTTPVLLADHAGDWVGALEAATRSAATGGARLRCTAVVPTQLHRLAREGRLGDLAGFDAVLVGGAPTDEPLRRAAHDAGVRIVTTYGMAETCGGCVYDGEPLDGVTVRLAADGRVHLGGPVLFDGYPDDPVATAAALVDGELRTQDVGRFDADGRLHVLGRVDDVVLSGGVNVNLLAVETVLREHPAIADAAVVALPDPEWGARVVAVARAVGTAPPLAELRDHVGATLPRSWAPRALVLVDELPRLSPSGKTDRLAAQALAARRAVPRPAPDAS